MKTQPQPRAARRFVGFRLDADVYADLAKNAEHHDRSVSASLRRAVRLLLAAEARDPRQC
jgi:hypothetical protein